MKVKNSNFKNTKIEVDCPEDIVLFILK